MVLEVGRPCGLIITLRLFYPITSLCWYDSVPTHKYGGMWCLTPYTGGRVFYIYPIFGRRGTSGVTGFVNVQALSRSCGLCIKIFLTGLRGSFAVYPWVSCKMWESIRLFFWIDWTSVPHYCNAAWKRFPWDWVHRTGEVLWPVRSCG